MEDEFYNLVVKGNDLKTYARRFQELAVLCPNMIPNTEKLMEVLIGGLPKRNDLKTYARRFPELAVLCPNMIPNTEKLMEVLIGGLPRSIEGNVTALKPQTLKEAINITQRNTDNNNYPNDRNNNNHSNNRNNNNYQDNRNNYNRNNDYHQQQNRRQETVRTYAATSTENKRTELVEESSNKAEKSSSKRKGEELEQESSKKQKNTVYYLLFEKMYPLTNYILTQMWNDVRLQVGYEVEMAYDLLRLGTILKEKLFVEFDEFMAMNIEGNSEYEFESEEPPFEKISLNTDYKIKTSLKEPPSDVELKPLPDNFEYVFSEEPSFLPKIQLLEDKKLIVQKQRRLNLNMQEVVKKEIVKLLDTAHSQKEFRKIQSEISMKEIKKPEALDIDENSTLQEGIAL
uniref:Reverse transcriptase domain-containing protein n=1 Tax=Tanacetum cinerariifolium TaxID=118510 RepID=A0A6L2P515_TANCI|nr:reverse transcriptase domain-containing protein [Tanacetum cinerariifolium]